MKKYLNNPPSEALMTEVVTQLNAVITLLSPHRLAITNEEKVGIRTMAEGREGYVRLVSNIATQHEQSLSRADNPADLIKLLDLDELCEIARQAAMETLEMVNDIQFGNSADIMVLADGYVDNLQASRSRNTSLDSAMNEIDDWNRRFGNRDEKTPPPPTPTPPTE